MQISLGMVNGKHLVLNEEILALHMLLVGIIGSGKSFKVMSIIVQLIAQLCGVTLVDIDGKTADDTIAMLVRHSTGKHGQSGSSEDAAYSSLLARGASSGRGSIEAEATGSVKEAANKEGIQNSCRLPDMHDFQERRRPPAWVERRKIAIAIIRQHPVTALLLFHTLRDLFPSLASVKVFLHNLSDRKRRKIRAPETIDTYGRPAKLYHTKDIKNKDHEYQLSQVLLAYYPAPCVRGNEVNRTFLPDAELWLGRLFYVELDRDKEGINQVKSRFEKLRTCEHVQLWVCPDRQRLEKLRKAAAAIHDTSAFAVLDDVIRDPYGPIWTDYYGHAMALPRPNQALTNPTTK